MMAGVHIPAWGRLPVLLGLAALILGGLLGGRWLTRLPVSDVIVRGAEMANSEDILRLADVPADTPLFSLEPTLISDRAARDPWVERAAVRRKPDGTVLIEVAERTPVALMLDGDGSPSHYVDREGYRMPYRLGRAFDVPLLTGIREPYHPMGALRGVAVRRLLDALPTLDPNLDAITSEWHWQEDHSFVLRTVPATSGQSIDVRMGDRDYSARLVRLRAFWDQAILPRPDLRYQWIDLRFDQQIVTKEIA